MAMQGLTRKRRWIWLNLSHGGDPSRQFGGKSWRSSWKHLKTIRLQYIGFGWIIGDSKWSKIQWQCAEWFDTKNDQVKGSSHGSIALHGWLPMLPMLEQSSCSRTKVFEQSRARKFTQFLIWMGRGSVQFTKTWWNILGSFTKNSWTWFD